MRIHGHGTGVTVLELMVTLAIATILLGMAVPAYELFTNRQRMKAAVASLHNDLLAARSQAIYRRAVVVACPGDPDAGCLNSNRWTAGWIVFEDSNGDQQRQEEEFLLRHGMGRAAVEIFSPASRKTLRFFPDGSTPGSNGSISLCGRGGPKHARRLVISNIGRIRRDLFPGINPAFCPT